MLGFLDRIDGVVQQHLIPEVHLKADHSPVTTLDIVLSKLVEEIHSAHFARSIFYSEENYNDWAFPLMAIDPLDGTREYAEGRSEWAVSIGYFTDEKFEGEGWVYNPMTRERFDAPEKLTFTSKANYVGEVSGHEWKSGLYKNHKSEKFQIKPLGSIAYKLGRLSYGKTDFVVSLNPKNIWDIAGGTLLCNQAGLKFYSQGRLVTKVQKTFEPPLIWCPEELFSELSALFP